MTQNTKNITLNSWLFTFESSLIIYLQPIFNEIQNVLLIRIPEIFWWLWFKEVQFVLTPRDYFYEIGSVSERRSQGLFWFWMKTPVKYLCVCVKVCKRHLKFDFYVGVKNPKPPNDLQNMILFSSICILRLCIKMLNLVV